MVRVLIVLVALSVLVAEITAKPEPQWHGEVKRQANMKFKKSMPKMDFMRSKSNY